MQRAFALYPSDPILPHILGVWCYHVASLSWVMRQAATALFGAPPTSTYEEALQFLTQSDALGVARGKQLMTTRLMAAKTCYAMSRLEEAKGWLLKSAEVQPGPGEDEDATEQQAQLASTLGVTLPLN